MLESVTLESNILQAEGLLDDAVQQFLTEMGALLAADAAAMSPVDEGQLKGSWDYQVDTAAIWKTRSGTSSAQAHTRQTGTAERHRGMCRSPDTPVRESLHTKAKSRWYTAKTGCGTLRQTARRHSTHCSMQQIRTCRKRKSIWQRC